MFKKWDSRPAIPETNKLQKAKVFFNNKCDLQTCEKVVIGSFAFSWNCLSCRWLKTDDDQIGRKISWKSQ